MGPERRRPSRYRGLLLGLGSLLLAAVVQADPAPAAESSAPFLWQVRGATTTHYLLGSVHMLPKAAKRLPPGIVDAYRSADVLVFESDTTQLKSRAFSQQMLAAAQAPDGLAAEVDAATLSRVRTRMKQLRMPAAQCEPYQPWFCALNLELFLYRDAGYKGEYGIDSRLHEAAVTDRRAMAWFEPPDQHLALFTEMGPALSALLLQSAIAKDEINREEPAQMYRAWRGSDEAKIESVIAEMRRDFPALHEHLIGRRNRAWLPELERRLALPERQLIIVGASHWLGPEGLIARLREAGYEIRPYLPIRTDQHARRDVDIARR